MPSPFPGMDPYLEATLWPDVHNALVRKLRTFLTRQLRPKYTARLEIHIVEDTYPESEIGILYPDVEVRQSPDQSNIVTTPAPLKLPVIQPVEIRSSTTKASCNSTSRNSGS